MDSDLAHLIHTATGTLKAAEAALKQAQADLGKARVALGKLERLAQSELISGLPICETPITEHRRLHKSGRPAILDNDPELRAFVLARIDRLTFQQITDEIAASFPVERRVKRSSIHRWWQINRQSPNLSRNP